MYGYIGLFVDKEISTKEEVKSFYNQLNRYANSIKCETCLIEVDKKGNLYHNSFLCHIVKKDRRFQLIGKRLFFYMPLSYLDLGIVFGNNKIYALLEGLGIPYAGTSISQKEIIDNHQLNKLIMKSLGLDLRNEVIVSKSDHETKQAKNLKKLEYPIEVDNKVFSSFDDFQEYYKTINDDVYAYHYDEGKTFNVSFLGDSDDYYFSEIEEDYSEKVKFSVLKIVNCLKLSGLFSFKFRICDEGVYLIRIETSPLPLPFDDVLIIKELIRIAKKKTLIGGNNNGSNY